MSATGGAAPQSPAGRQRRRWLAAEMDKKRSAYTREKPLRLFAGTWNVNGCAPHPAAQMHRWLFPAEHEGAHPFDVYMLGFQEVQPLAWADAVRTDATRGRLWRERMQRVLGSDYEQVGERQLVGIMVVVFMRKNHVPFLSNVQLSYAATGWMNAVGNKGGVAVRFQLYDKTISCVACHLSAHGEFVERRNQDFRDVMRKAVFLPLDADDASKSSPSTPGTVGASGDALLSRRSAPLMGVSGGGQISGLPAVAAGTSSWLGSVAAVAATALSDMSAGANTALLNDPNAIKIFDHDVVFWLGDLNYRIDASLAEVMRWIDERNWDELYRADQLQRQMKTCDIFDGFREGPIRFAPTYKLHREKDGYKTGETPEQTRTPAYTDRILWKMGGANGGGISSSKLRLTLQHYTSAPVYSSDHRPVYASFEMMFGVEDVKRKLDIKAKVERDLDAREESMRPALQISPLAVDFGDVFFEQRCTRSVSIKNAGSSTTFISINVPAEVPTWFHFDASAWRHVEIPPGKSVQLQLAVLISSKDGTANQISRQGCRFDVRVGVSAEPGELREAILVRGKYVPTTLGLSLETLAMLDKPVLALRNNDREANTLANQELEPEFVREPGCVPLSIPKELWLMVHALMRVPDGGSERCMDTCPGIFLQNGDEDAAHRVQSLVDRGERIPRDLSGYAIGTSLLDVLKNLDDAVVPTALYPRAIDAARAGDLEAIEGVLHLLPPLNANTFWYIIGFLCESAAVRDDSDQARKVAAMFGEALLRSPDENPKSRDVRFKTDFIQAAFRIQQTTRVPPFRAVFDLSRPSTHPRRIQGKVSR